MGYDVIVFGEEERDITEDNRSEYESVGEWNEQEDEDKTADNRGNYVDGIEELEDDEVVGTPTDNDNKHDYEKNII